jgi:hypothetical protein
MQYMQQMHAYFVILISRVTYVSAAPLHTGSSTCGFLREDREVTELSLGILHFLVIKCNSFYAHNLVL